MKELVIRISLIASVNALERFLLPKLRSCFLIITGLTVLSIYGCSSSEKKYGVEDEFEKEQETIVSEVNIILEVARMEQKIPMYQKEADTTLLYWLNDLPAELYGYTKCNVFALNVLQRAGYKTPEENCTSYDLFDTSLFKEILPVVSINECSSAMPGDIVIWNGHVIIFEKHLLNGDDEYALSWWAGTRKEDNGSNIINNVCHGNYKLEREYIVRRPVKKR